MTDHSFSRFCLLAGLLFAGNGPVSASDGLLIWSPSRASDTSYNARLGVRVPGWTDAAAGMDVGVTSAKKGGPADVPVKLWGRVSAQALQTPAYQTQRDLDVRINARTGNAAAQMAYRGTQIVSKDVDVELTRNVTLRYDGASETWQGIDINQTVRWSVPLSGSSVTATIAAVDDFKRLGAGIGLEQRVGPAVTLSGKVGQAAGGDLSASVKARYSVTW